MTWLLCAIAASALAASPRTLPTAQVQALRRLLIEDPRTAVYSPAGFQSIAETIDTIAASPHMDRLHSDLGFKALVESDPAARQAVAADLTAHSDGMKGVKNLMYYSLVRVMAASAPMPQRVETASQLAEVYADFFDGLAAAPSKLMQEEAARAAVRLRDPKHIVEPLAYERRLFGRWNELAAAYQRLRPATAAQTEGSPAPWVMPSPVTKRLPSEARESRKQPMAELEMKLRNLVHNVMRLETRQRLAREPRFSDRLRAHLAEQADQWLDWLGGSMGSWRAVVTRFSEVTIGRTFLDQRPHRIVGVPNHPGLSLIPEPLGAFRLEARFKTDIADPAIRDAIKRSIEEYWKGPFRLGGRSYFFYTHVTIEPLRRGEEFPETWLKLIDAKDSVTHAGFTSIAMGRNPANFDYGVPAHEFGHVLGLSDQYTEDFDPETWSSLDTHVPGSLMGSRTGPVLERDLRTVYQLLRRHSLVAQK